MAYPSFGLYEKLDIYLDGPGSERTASVFVDLWETFQIVEDDMACTGGIVGIDAVGKIFGMTGCCGIGIVETQKIAGMSTILSFYASYGYSPWFHQF